MTAMAISNSTKKTIRLMQTEFLALLPGFERRFSYAFRDLSRERREEAVAEATAIAWNGFCQAKAAGKNPSEFPAAIAGFAARRVRIRRPAFGEWTSKDVMSPCARQRHGFKVVGYDQVAANDVNSRHRRDKSPRWWMEALVDSRQTNVPRQVAFRIDFANWLKTLSTRQRSILRELAKESTTTEVAKKFGVSMSRVSQYRRELEASWVEFNASMSASNNSHVSAKERGRRRHVRPNKNRSAFRVVGDR